MSTVEAKEGRSLAKLVVMKDRRSKAIGVAAVPCKGAREEYTIRETNDVLDEWGRQAITRGSVTASSLDDFQRALNGIRKHEACM